MKKMLIAASAVGATIAGLILYFRKHNKNAPPKQLKDAAEDAYHTMYASLGHVERNTLAMG